jgi:hypothetical protein
MDYVLEQVQTWDGFNDVAHLAPGNAYYNLSQAIGLILDYNVLQVASIPECCIFRFVLQDRSHCETIAVELAASPSILFMDEVRCRMAYFIFVANMHLPGSMVFYGFLWFSMVFYGFLCF